MQWVSSRMIALLLLGCSSTPPPASDPTSNATVVQVSLTTSASASPGGMARLARTRQNEVRDPDGSLRLPAVDAYDYGEVAFGDVRTIEVPPGEVRLRVEGFDATGLCDTLSATGDSGFPCTFDGWLGSETVYVGDFWEDPVPNAVAEGGSIAIDISVEESCLCAD